MGRMDIEKVMAKDIKVTLSATTEVASDGGPHYTRVKLPRTAFNIRSAIQILQQEHAKLTGEWVDFGAQPTVVVSGASLVTAKQIYDGAPRSEEEV